MIYLDHNATTPLDERVLAAMLPFLQTYYGNPSSLYRHGRLVRSAIDTAREQVAALVGVSASQIIFTSGGTEANNLALATLNHSDKLAVSAIEHPSILETALYLQDQGHELTLLAVDSKCVITQDAINQVIECQPALVSMMLANNETGVIQPIAHYAEQLKAHNIKVHTDAVQAVGKIPVQFEALNVDFMTLSSHKIYGAKGCGALVVGRDMIINPLLRGGGQEQNRRSGTENVAAIVAFGKAAELAHTELTTRCEYLLTLRTLLEQQLATIPRLTIFAQHAIRLPNTVLFGIDEVDGEMLVMKLDKKSIAVSSGSACASGGSLPSHVLLAMRVDAMQAKTAVRISLGISNTAAELTEFVTQLKSLIL
ncbi:cysteine desulfurase [Crenothrix sp. D3]|nr:cysteine desulfurase [Crenothrix sp. D3]